MPKQSVKQLVFFILIILVKRKQEDSKIYFHSHILIPVPGFLRDFSILLQLGSPKISRLPFECIIVVFYFYDASFF